MAVLESGLPQGPGMSYPTFTPGHPLHGPTVNYSGAPSQSIPTKRTYSMSEDLQNSSALQAQLQASANLHAANASHMPGQMPDSTHVQRGTDFAEEGDGVAFKE